MAKRAVIRMSGSDSPENDAELRILRRIDELGRDYVENAAPYIVNHYYDLGLAAECAAILGRYITNTAIHFQTDLDYSTIEVASCDEQTDVTVTSEKWFRKAQISRVQQKSNLGKMALAYKDVQGEAPKAMAVRELKKLAVDWAFYELSADMAAESCYMQRSFGRYVPDYNGSSPHFRTNLEISKNYLKDRAADEAISSEAVEDDHYDFRAGNALILLHDAALRRGIFDSSARAKLWVRNLRIRYPSRQYARFSNKTLAPDPHSQSEIAMRLEAVTPVETAKIHEDWDRYLLSFED